MKKKVSGVYVIKCIANGRIYLGSSVDIARRWYTHVSMLKSNKHSNKSLQEDFNRFGWDRFSFRIKEECLQKDLYVVEQKYLNRYDKDTLYNKQQIRNTKKKIRRGKEASNYKKRWSEQVTGSNNPNCKYTVEQIIKVKTMLRDGISVKDITKETGIKETYISLIKNGYRWTSVKLEEEM